jgi:uncharacterized protein (DUF885 family)
MSYNWRLREQRLCTPWEFVIVSTKLRFLVVLGPIFFLMAGALLPEFLVAAARQEKQKDEAALDLTGLVGKPYNEMALVVTRFNADWGNLNRFYNVTSAPTRQTRLKHFLSDWAKALQKLNADKLTEPARGDLESLQKRVADETAKVEALAKAQAEIVPLLPFEPLLIELLESHQRLDKMDGMKAAATLNTVKLHIQQMQKNFAAEGDTAKENSFKATKAQADRAADTTAVLRKSLSTWYNFYNGYDPAFTWWTADLYREVDRALSDYATLVRGKAAEVAVMPSTVAHPDWATLGDPANPRPKSFPLTESDAPDLAQLIAFKPSEMRDVLARFQKDRGGKAGGMGGGGKGAVGPSLEKAAKLRDTWMNALAEIDFDKLSQSGKVDYVIIKHNLDRDIRRAELQLKSADAMKRLVPFEPLVEAMEEAVRKNEKPATDKAAPALTELTAAVAKAHAATEAAHKAKDGVHPVLANRTSVAAAIDTIKELRASVKKWVALGDDEFAKQAAGPAQDADKALETYANLLVSTGAMKQDGSGIGGRPIGRDALMVELFAEMIAMTPEDLLAFATKEYAWCEAEMKKASREMGCGDDWPKAVEMVKRKAVPPGDQPALIRDLVWEAILYLNKHDLITVPSVASESWLMQMMSPQKQLTAPFFLGGAVISVSYPTNTMPFDARMQSMRGNNPHFSRATAHHEVIPGHNLQQFMNARNGDKRGAGTPFWTEGGALYWEFVLYEKGFPKTPEDRVGFLVWRMHRCARIEFSLNFHMGRWTPQECIDFLVAKVGFDRDNAAAEVRRSFGGGYGPLYQLAYMTGGKQLYALRKELVLSGKMKEREFHDKIWQSGAMPIEMVRALVADTPLTRDWTPSWKFFE